MKVLFLDVDGVLNHGIGEVMPCKCTLVQQILIDAKCSLVISSSWRKHPHMLDDHLWRYLGQSAKDSCIGMTPVLDRHLPCGLWAGATRGHEIAAWLKHHKDVTRFAILDDDSNVGDLTPHLFLTNSLVGVTHEIAQQVIQHLNAP
jgi:hypothetical protein